MKNNPLRDGRARASLVLLQIISFPALARADDWWLEDHSYFDPHIAAPRDAMVKVLFPAWSPAFPFAQTEGTRLVWDISLGKEIPIGGYETSPTRENDFSSGEGGFGVWLPVSFHMVEDLTGDDSSPILNTDYRFGAMFKGRFAIQDQVWLKARLYVGHESTHVGDEFALAAQRNVEDRFLRINVSHEDWDVAAGADMIVSEAHELRGLIGLVGLLRPSQGYYSTDTLETNGAVVPASNNNVEPYLSFEYFYLEGLVGAWAPWLSTDLRYRSVYDYTRAASTIPEDRQLSINILAGLRNQERTRAEKGKVDLYARFYYGVNPAGQFRSQGDYVLFGFGFHVPI